MTANMFLVALTLAHGATLESANLNVSVGDKFTYETSITSQTDAPFGAFSTKTTEVMTLEVVSSSDGWFRFKATTDQHEIESDAPGPMAGRSQMGMIQSYDVSPKRKMRAWKLEDRGSYPEEDAEGMRSQAKTIESAGFQSLVLPDGDLAVGTRWSHESKPLVPSFGGAQSDVDGKLKIEYKVLEFTGSGGDRAVVIEAEVSGDYFVSISADQGEFEMDMAVEGLTKFWVRLADGVVTKMETEMETDISADFGEVTTTTKISLKLKSN